MDICIHFEKRTGFASQENVEEEAGWDSMHLQRQNSGPAAPHAATTNGLFHRYQCGSVFACDDCLR